MSSSRAECSKDSYENYGDQSRMKISSATMIKPEEDDRFSSLPDALAHCILSFVYLDDFARLMFVSKRWNQLCLSSTCLSAPCLTLMTNNNSSTHDHLTHLNRFMGHKQVRILWLPFHRGRKRKRYLRKFCDNDKDPVFTCLRECVSCCDPENVEVYCLSREGCCCKPPLSLFFAQGIRNLVLTVSNSALTFRSFPLHSPSRLENLTLKSVKIPSKSFGTLISLYCPKLKQLRLYECSGMKSLEILSKSVEHVEMIQEKCSILSRLFVRCVRLRTLLITWYSESLTRARLELYVPELEHFEWKGFPLRIYADRKYQHIKSATIYCTWPTGKSLDELYATYLYELVTSMEMTKSLHLLARTIEILFRNLSPEKFIPSLNGVETLHIDDCYLTNYQVPAIAFILKKMPNLKNIYVSSSKAIVDTLPEVFGFKMDYWEAQDLKCIKTLKTATLVIHKEGNATELVKYFVKHGNCLESLKVSCPSAMVSAVSGQIQLVKKSNVGTVAYVQGNEA